MATVSIAYYAGILLAALSAALIIKAQGEQRHGHREILSFSWLFSLLANVSVMLTIFAAGLGAATFGWTYVVFQAALFLAVLVPGGSVTRAAVDMANTPGQITERLVFWTGIPDRKVLWVARARLRQLERKPSKASEDGARLQARKALVDRARKLVNDAIPRYLSERRQLHGGIIEVRNALPWRSGRFHFKVLQGSSDPDEGNHFIRSVAGLLEDWDDSLTRQVTEETERDLEELGRRYMATQDKLGASLILLVKINARWYLLIGNNDDDEFRRMLDELDDLIDNTQLLLDDTRQELDDASQLEGNTQRTQDAQEIVQEAAP